MSICRRIFGRRVSDQATARSYKEVQTTTSGMSFLGHPGGSGEPQLVAELTQILNAEGSTDMAHISGIRYAGEQVTRLALILCTEENPAGVAQTIGRLLQEAGLAPVDILFFHMLGHEHQQYFSAQPPFYRGSNVAQQ